MAISMGQALIDLDHLDKYIAGDDALRDEILSIFEDQVDSLLEGFAVDLSDDDWQSIAHKMKGASRGIGAWSVGDLCEKAEDMIGDNPEKLSERETLLTQVRSELIATTEEARRIRDRVN